MQSYVPTGLLILWRCFCYQTCVPTELEKAPEGRSYGSVTVSQELKSLRDVAFQKHFIPNSG